MDRFAKIGIIITAVRFPSFRRWRKGRPKVLGDIDFVEVHILPVYPPSSHWAFADAHAVPLRNVTSSLINEAV